MTSPPPIPVETTTPNILVAPIPAPSRLSASATAVQSPNNPMGAFGNKALISETIGNFLHCAIFTGEMVPFTRSMGPADAIPMRSAVKPLSAFLRTGQIGSLVFDGTWRRSRIWSLPSTRPIAILVAPMSSASVLIG